MIINTKEYFGVTKGVIVTIENARAGLKVRRGPDWEWDEQDGGGVGTIISVGQNGYLWVDVHWDVTDMGNAYRIGGHFAGKARFDLIKAE